MLRKYVNNSITTIMLFVISVDFTVRVRESCMKPYIKMFDLRFCDIDEKCTDFETVSK